MTGPYPIHTFGAGAWQLDFLDHGVHVEQETGGYMITLVIVLAAVSLMVIFSVQNAAPVVVSFLSWKFEASLAVIILLCVLTGILIGGATVSFWRLKRSIKKRKAIDTRTVGQQATTVTQVSAAHTSPGGTMDTFGTTNNHTHHHRPGISSGPADHPGHTLPHSPPVGEADRDAIR